MEKDFQMEERCDAISAHYYIGSLARASFKKGAPGPFYVNLC